MELYSPYEVAVQTVGYQQVPDSQLDAVAEKVQDAVDQNSQQTQDLNSNVKN